MRRSGSLGIVSNLLRTQIGVRRNVVAAQGPQVRFVGNLTGTGLTWANGSAAPNLVDVAPGDQTTWVGQTAGAAQTAWVAGIYDLGTPQVITRVRYRTGAANGNTYFNTAANRIEASTDGVNWVSAWTGGNPSLSVASGSFAWEVESDFTTITSTAYRYWRIIVQDVFVVGNPDARIGDFRLYTSGGIVL